MQGFSEQINRIISVLDISDAVVVGAGAGLSTSAGFIYNGERFHAYFRDFIEKYGFEDMYSGGFYPFSSVEEHWAYWSRYIYVNRYMDAPKPVYETLYELVKDKNYFVLTTNVDHCFQKAGFDKERLFYTQGDYGLLQCSVPCCNKTYDNEKIISRMVREQSDMKIPPSLVPRCPVCGAPMTMNLRSDDRFVEDEGWHKACKRYSDFINEYKMRKILFLELGVGYNTPIIIKFPFMRMTAENKNALYVRISLDSSDCISEIADRSVCINRDIGEVLERLYD